MKKVNQSNKDNCMYMYMYMNMYMHVLQASCIHTQNVFYMCGQLFMERMVVLFVHVVCVDSYHWRL